MSATDHAHAHDDGKVHSHIAPARFYWGIFAALVVLTVITVRVSYIDFGSLNTVIALLIATIKASLVAAFFMHLRHDKLFNTLAFLAAFLFLGIFVFLTYEDVGKRGDVDPTNGGNINPISGEVAPGGMPSSAPAPAGASHEAPKHH